MRDYYWLTPAMGPLNRAYGLEELRDVTGASGVSGTIVVQAATSLGETLDLLDICAASSGLIKGVVGWLAVEDDVSRQLAQLQASPHYDRLVGVRHPAQDERDVRWLVCDDVIRGVAALGRTGHVFELLVRPPQLPAAIELAAALPDNRFVLDHAGKPPLGEGDLGVWKAEISRLAALENVSCKLSGLVTEARPGPLDADSFRVVVDHVLTAFGPARVMFGSDWPVCRLRAEYAEVLNLVATSLAGLSSAETARVTSETARSVYGLD